MASNVKLFSAGKFEFRLHHLLIIGILAISFSISFLLRSQPADYAFTLNEFDPFFNYRATEFIVDNGIFAYFDWYDDRSWYPQGRDVSATAQVMLHVTAATLYSIFGGNNSLNDFTIIFPVIFGSLTTIVIFALVRTIGGTTAGLFSALFFSLSIPILIRGTIGWFKSEPLGLFYGLLGIYLFLSGIKTDNSKIALSKLVGGGIFFSLALSAWGGIQFFVIPLGLFFLALPFMRRDFRFIIWAIPVFVFTLLATAFLFERLGTFFIFGMAGFGLIVPTLFLIASIAIQKLSKKENRIRNNLLLLGGTIVGGIILIIANFIFHLSQLPSFRYLNVLNPLLTTTDALTDSVAEHATTTIQQSFWFFSILMIFAGLGIWLILRNKESLEKFSVQLKGDMISFALILGLTGVYISSTFVRLEVFASISIIILASIGLSIISAEILKQKSSEKRIKSNSPSRVIKISFVVAIITLLLVPTFIPSNTNWVSGAKAIPTIINGGTTFSVISNDWFFAMEWLKENTPNDAVIASWWDYGYWITTLAERISIADNATLANNKIVEIAEMLFSPPDEAWTRLQKLDADYVLIFIASQKIQTNPEELFLLGEGADESKKQWFIAIAGKPHSKFLESDGFSGTNEFWNNTLLGRMIPYSPLAYIDPISQQQSETYQPGSIGVYKEDVKFPEDGTGPLKLVYASPSFYRENTGPILGIFIYEINKDYSATIEP